MTLDPLLIALFTHLRIPLAADPLANLAPLFLNFGRIPYENLTKIIGVAENATKIVKQSPEEVIKGFISEGTGGTCFPLTATLVRLVRSLGVEAHPILADRRYGLDTHCALICRLTQNRWHLVDPGYLITRPCEIPIHGEARYELPIVSIELRTGESPRRVDLYTFSGWERAGIEGKYRLTYKIEPVDELAFHAAWDRSFDWEMMRYPVISQSFEGTQVYVQKNNLFERSASASIHIPLSEETFAREISRRLSLSENVVRRALRCLR